jgi:hypothetical protein
VHPVFEEFTSLGGVGDQRAGMWTESGEQWQFLAAHQNVDRIDLDEPDAVKHLAEMSAVDPTGRTSVIESLRAQRDSPRLRKREFGHRRSVAGGARHHLQHPESVGRFGDRDALDDDVGLRLIATAGGHVLHGVDDVETLDHLAEQAVLRRQADA